MAKLPKTKVQTLKSLFFNECKHKKEYELGEYQAPFKWQDCKECICAFIPFIVGDNIERDVCFAFWHSEIRSMNTCFEKRRMLIEKDIHTNKYYELYKGKFVLKTGRQPEGLCWDLLCNMREAQETAWSFYL